MFEMYASGTKSFEEISNILYEAGFESDCGAKVYRSLNHRVIVNPFYYGVMVRRWSKFFRQTRTYGFKRIIR